MFHRFLSLGLLGLIGFLTFACGGGGDASDALQPLYVERFSVPNFSGILLDEAVSFVLSEEIDAASLNHDSVQIRTGPQGGQAPRGVFVKGTFLFDPETRTRVVVDPDQIGADIINSAELTGVREIVNQYNEIGAIIDVLRDDVPPPNGPGGPDYRGTQYRYDLGAKSPVNGNRQVLFNRTRTRQITFVPENPTRPDLSDSGYVANSLYTIVVPAFPTLNTVTTTQGDPLLPREGRVFTSTFTTVPDTAPFLFLGGENQGRPRVINTDPENGGLTVPVDIRIRIRFSHAIDPRTVSPDNFLLTIPNQGGQIYPVSLFLRQSRLGICEVVLTPLSDLTGDTVYQVNVTPGVLDLLRSDLEPFTFSFSTGAGFTPSDIVEPFVTFAKRMTGTTANWNTTYERNNDGVVTGALIAEFSPWAGNGVDKAFDPPIGTTTYLDTVDQTSGIFKEHQFTTFLIQGGAIVEGRGSRGLVIRSQGSVSIQGDLILSGTDGTTGQTGGIGGLSPTGGAGGSGGPGGYKGGDGAFTTLSAANFDAFDGSGPIAGTGGRGGHTGDAEQCTNVPGDACTDEAGVREGGGGGGHSAAGGGANIRRAKPSISPNTGGDGGDRYDPIDPPFIPIARPDLNPPANWGGAGGGGGGGEDDSAAGGEGDGIAGGQDEGGGGGGGGGGGLLVVSYTTVSVVGRIVANGGAGGNTFNASNGSLGQGAPGGGGAGGSIWIQCRLPMSLPSGAEITALGGAGGQGDGDGFIRSGGDGAAGYIFLQDETGSITAPSTVQPTPDTAQFTPDVELNSMAMIGWFDQFIVTPNYDPAIIDQELNSGIITIEVQGAREDLSNPGNPVDPDVDVDRLFTTDWQPISLIDSIDNFRFLRIRVMFEVNPLQEFSDPLPIIHQITIPVKTQPD